MMSLLKATHRKIARKKHALTSLSFLSFGNVITAFAGFFTVVILSNFLSKNDYGNYKYVYSVVGLLSALSFTGGFRTMVIQSVSRGYDGIVNHLFKSNPLLNLPMMIGALCISGYYFYRDNTLIAYSIPLVALGALFVNNAVIAASYLNGRKEYKALLKYQSIISGTNLIVLLILVTLTSNLIIIIAGTSASVILTSLWYIYRIQRRELRNDTLDTKILAYGKHLNVLNILSTILNNIDSILIFQLLGSHSLALYALATPFVDRIIGIFKTSYFFALPKFTEIGPARARALLYRRSFMAFIIGLGVVGIYYLFAPLFFKLFFPAYLDSIALSVLFAFNIPIVALGILPTAYIDSLIEIKNKYILHACTFSLRISTLLICIHYFGVVGVIWSELITRFVTFLIIVILIERYNKKLS